MEDYTIDSPRRSGPPPKNYLVESILVTLFCCLPLGIVGIIHASKVEGLWFAGDQEGALKAADDAKKWVKYAVIAGAVFIVLYLGFIAAMIGFGAMNNGFDDM